MRLGKAQRLALRQQRLAEFGRRRRVDREVALCASLTVNTFAKGQSFTLTPVAGSLSRLPSTGTSKPGSNLFRAKAPAYSIEKPPRLGSKSTSKGKGRWANT